MFIPALLIMVGLMILAKNHIKVKASFSVGHSLRLNRRERARMRGGAAML